MARPELVCGVVVVPGCCDPYVAEEHCWNPGDDCRCDLRHHDIFEPGVCGLPRSLHRGVEHTFVAATEEVR